MSNNSLTARLLNRGGVSSNDRIKQGKLWSFHNALKNDYNSREIQSDREGVIHRCLINTNNLKPDYDKKIISIDYVADLQAGDTFKCLDDNTHWLVYLPILTETAYLRAEIIRCRYTLDVDGTHYWVYFQGPVETDVRWLQEKGINYVAPNLSGSIYIKRDEKTLEFFHRFSKIKLNDKTWNVEAIDTISVPGIIELEVQEYYENPEAELPKVVSSVDGEIEGAESVLAGDSAGYLLPFDLMQEGFVWSVSGLAGDYKLEVHKETPNVCNITVPANTAAKEFTVSCGNLSTKYVKKVVVQPARKDISITGDKLVYPYGKYKYLANTNGTFAVSNEKVKIVEQDANSCLVEIITGRSGRFNLTFTPEQGEAVIVPIKIGSL